LETKTDIYLGTNYVLKCDLFWNGMSINDWNLSLFS